MAHCFFEDASILILIAGQGSLETWLRRCLEPCLETRDFGRHALSQACPAVPWGEHLSAVKLGVPWPTIAIPVSF
jgi:hypothetical protein